MGLFDFFEKKTKSININFSEIAFDFHSHLVPNVDDGSTSPEETIEILTYMKSIGYQQIITTPHLMTEGYTNTSTSLQNALAPHHTTFNEILSVSLSAEYYIDDGFRKLMENGELLTFCGNKLLIETNINYSLNEFDQIIFDLIRMGVCPILAHPERYQYFHSDNLEFYDSLKDKGVELQLNLFSLIGSYGLKVQKMAENLIEANLIDYACSDIHRAKQLGWFEMVFKTKSFEKLLKSASLKNKQLIS